MTKLSFNYDPYFDDFDGSQNDMKVLFRPGRPVQARELNTLQSQLQDQVSKFANHIFKNGSKVSNAVPRLYTCAYVRLLNSPTVSAYIEGTQLVGETSGIHATLIKGVDVEGDDPATLYVVYTNSAIDGVTSTFIPGENINFLNADGIPVLTTTVRCPSCPGSGLTDTIPPVGKGQLFTLGEGVLYYEGMFLNTPKQDIIVTKYLIRGAGDVYSGYETCKIGLDFIQTVVTSDSDPTLLDPSLGYPNSTAPGADRYRVELKLVKRTYSAEDGENFILICKIGENMRIEYMKSDSEYADLMDTLAKRTYEQSGDFTVRSFRISFLNAKKATAEDPLGYSLTGSADQLVALMSPSIAYVKGYRVETISETPVLVDKARDTSKTESFINHFGTRTYILGTVKGTAIWPNVNSATSILSPEVTVSLYDAVTTGSAVAGNVIGSCKVSDIEHVSGAPASGAAVYRYYVYDLSLNTGKTFADVKSFCLATASFYNNTVNDTVSTVPEVYSTNNTTLIYNLSRPNVKTLRSIIDSNNGSISIVVRKKLSGVADASGNITFSTATNEYFDNIGSSFVGWYTSGGVTTSFDPAGLATFSSTNLSLALGAPAAGASVYCIIDVLNTNQKEKTKTYSTTTKQTTTAPPAALGDTVPLGYADVIRINSINLYLDGSPETPIEDVTDEFELVDGTTDMFYGECLLKRVKVNNQTPNAAHRLAINLSYYAHSGSQGFFTVDSYNSALTDPGSGVTYENLPTYVSTSGVSYPVASCIDFRAIKLTDPVTSVLPAIESTAIFDIEYYLGRADLIQVSKDGRIYSKRGAPSDTPRPPAPDSFSMPLYEVFLEPYTYSLSDVRTKYIDNRRYTMRDIGGLEKRITNIEYYTALNLLEKSAADMSIKDSNGLDRFKNGFVADSFQDFQAADLDSPEFLCAADRSEMQLRPQFKSSNRRLILDEAGSSNFVRRGNVAMLPYTEKQVIDQPYATKSLSINPYLIYSQQGTMMLSPNNDVWSDDTRLPVVNVDVNSNMGDLSKSKKRRVIFGGDWGSWIDQNRTHIGRHSGPPPIIYDGPIPGTGIPRPDSGVSRLPKSIESRVTTYNIDEIVKDVQLTPFIRENVVEFYATHLKPNTRVYPFFDGQPVSDFCKDSGFQLTAANASVTTALVSYGSALITDANGEIRGDFRIPAGRFFTGEKKFILTDDPGLTGDPDAETTRAEAVYFAGGLDVTKQDVTVNVITPEKTPAAPAEATTSTSTPNTTPTPAADTSRETTPPTSNDVPPTNDCLGGKASQTNSGCGCAVHGKPWLCGDPVAQAFAVDEDMFITAVDLFFQQVDMVSDRIFVDIRNMVNGYPGPTKLATMNYTPTDIAASCSPDSSTAFRVEFNTPIFVESGNQYCFVVGGASPNTKVWVSHLGQEVVNMPGKIVETPPTGQVSFRSLNGSTWNAEQFEQIKFKLYKAVFNTSEMTLKFENSHSDDSWELPENPIQTEAGKTTVRITHPDHGLNAGDRVSISLFDEEPLEVSFTDFIPQIGQILHTTTGRGKLRKIIASTTAGRWKLWFDKVSGVFRDGQTWNADAMTRHVRDVFLHDRIGSRRTGGIIYNGCFGTVHGGIFANKYGTDKIAGIPVENFNEESTTGSTGSTVTSVDSRDTYTITMPTPATTTGTVGGTGVKIYAANEKYEMFNCAGAYLPYRASEKWTLEGIAHGDAGSPFETIDYNRMAPVTFTPAADTFLGQPYKIASEANEDSKLGIGERSINIYARFTSPSPNLSPVINLDTFSFTAVSNKVGWISQTAMESTPASPTNWFPETDPSLGSEPFKYVTKTINLANPAADLHIYLDVYKTIDSDFDVYIKTLPVYGDTKIDDAQWVKLTIEPGRSSVDLTDFIEYTLIASEQATAWSTEPFSSFKVKIVGRSHNSAKPPLFKNFRAIAIT